MLGTEPTSIIILILGVLGLGVMFWRVAVGSIVSYAAVLTAYFFNARAVNAISGQSLIFWSVALMIVLGLAYLQPERERQDKMRNVYMRTGALIGGLLGFIASHSSAAVIVWSAVGAIMASLAYSRTPEGRRAGMNFRSFADSLGAEGLPAVVNVALCATALMTIMN